MSILLNLQCAGRLERFAERRVPVADDEVVEQLALDVRAQPRVVLDVHVDIADGERASGVRAEDIDRCDAVRVSAAGADRLQQR
jgi:hypothetical protein